MSVLRSLLTAGVLASGLLWSLNGITATPAAQASGDRYEVTLQRNPDAACQYRVRFIHPVTKTADKCDFCRKTNLQAGKLPACVEACPTKALTFGNLDDPNSEISQLLRQKPTYRYKLALGTKPKLYRVPFKYGEVSQ